MAKKKMHPVFFICFILGLLFMAFGVYRDEVAVLYQKAIYICMECIGLG